MNIPRLDMNNTRKFFIDSLLVKTYLSIAEDICTYIERHRTAYETSQLHGHIIDDIQRMFEEDGFTVKTTMLNRLLISWPTITYGPETEKYKELYNKFNE